MKATNDRRPQSIRIAEARSDPSAGPVARLVNELPLRLGRDPVQDEDERVSAFLGLAELFVRRRWTRTLNRAVPLPQGDDTASDWRTPVRQATWGE